MAVMGWLRRRRGDDTDDAVDDEIPTVRIVPKGAVATDEVDADGVDGAAEGATHGTITIGGSDEPDIAYLDEELARDDTPGTLFIEDDGSDDPIPADVANPGIEPRMQQRRIGVRRAEGRRRLRWVLIVLAVVATIIAALAVVGSSLFSVDDVDVTGAVYTDQDVLDEVVDDIEGTPALLVDTVAAEEQLEAIPWVESARVSVDFPNKAQIEIREREPVASMAGSDGRFRVLDADGRVLDVIEGQPVAVAWISGPGTLELQPGEFASLGYASAASLVTKLTPDIRTRLVSMLVTPDGTDLRLMIVPQAVLDAEAEEGRPPVAAGLDLNEPVEQIEVRFGSAIGDSEQIEKLVRLQRQLDDIGTVDVSVIDVSTSQVTVS